MSEMIDKATSNWPQRLLGDLRKVLAVDMRNTADKSGFLPNFCNTQVIVRVVVIAELLALVVTLVTRRISLNIFQDLFLISLFIQWIALVSVGTLCGLRRYLNRLPNLYALGITYLLLLLITSVVTEAGVWVWWLADQINSPRPSWYGYIHVQNLAVSMIVAALALRYLLGIHELQQRTISEARAKMQALQSRIRPHFVFNSLNIIASLTRSAPLKAERAIEDMADLFRMMLSESENIVPVSKEIDVARKYLALEELRLDNRLNVNWDVGKFPRKANMPVLTLQPLLENAIHHGIEPNPSGGTIDVRLWEQDDAIHISVTNPLPQRKPRKSREPEHQALEDIRRRLKNHYGEAAKLEKVEENGTFVVNAILPIRGGTP